MSVEFDEQNDAATIPQSFSDTSPSQKGLVGFLLRKGIVKSEYQASLILTIIMLVCFALSGFFLWQTYGPRSTPQLTPEQIIQLQQLGIPAS
jgi:hypothetical protein